MARKTSERELKRMEQKGYRGRTDAYRYIRLNLERYLALGVGTSDGPSWETFAAMLGRENQRNKQGGPISRDSARKIFERASKDARDKKVEMLTGVPQRKQQPSHLPATWRPTPETAPTPATFSRPVIPQPSQPVRDGEARPRTAEEKVADIRQQFAQRSGR